MGGCYSVVMATKLKMFRRGGHGAATVLPVTSNDDGRAGTKPRSILGDAGTVDPDFSWREALACKTLRRKRLLLWRARPDADDDVQREVEITRRMSEAGSGARWCPCTRRACEDDDDMHLIMELCESGELFDRIFEHEHYFTGAIVEVVHITLCHDNGVMHRNLKPENFLLVNKSEESPLKAIDFGLSVYFKHILLCGFPPFWGDLIKKMLDPDPSTQLTAKQVLVSTLRTRHLGNNDGNLSLDELKEGFRINGHPVPEEEIKMLLQAMSNNEYLPKAFKFFDKDGSGFIQMAELMEALGDGELKPNEQVVNDIIREVDKDKVSTQ
ncbi:hypothetical protein SORBI_3002G262850 [Sorghum bicolor]|uniref:Protein kinase domain-containing protein n=1 Tax=Sorghum bicolor TaxID=4558 RepID=A0A1W0W5T2_SORBI|nr:hypothetical protein SORBI_3002G262850 [Sorghum bicolor]